MAVYRPTKDSKVWWYDFIFEGQRVRESAKTRSKTVAKDAERIRHRELEESYNGIKRRERARLFSVAAGEWLVLKSLTLAASSQRIERDNLKHLRPHFEKRLVTDIQAKDVSRYQQARLAEGASPKTINLEVGTLRAILRRHRVWAEIQQDVRMLAVQDDVGHAITLQEEAALLTACLKSRCRCLYLAVMLALNTGMRYSEIRLLRWRQVDFAARMLIVGKSKSPTGTGRAIPLNSRILSVLEMWAARFPGRQPAHFVFASEKYGAAGQTDTFGFTAGLVIYDKDPTRPIGNWKEAWEKAKQRAGRDSERQRGRRIGTAPVPIPRSPAHRSDPPAGSRHPLSGSGKHHGVVRGDGDSHVEALWTHRKPCSARCGRRTRRSGNSRRVPQKVPKVIGGRKWIYSVSG
jgi:integrase